MLMVAERASVVMSLLWIDGGARLGQSPQHV